jgi:hypothetical protein
MSLWYLHEYMYYNPNLFSSFNFLHSTLVLFYDSFSQFKVFILILHTEYMNHIQVLSFSTPPMHDLPLVWQIFHDIAVLVLGLYVTYEREHAAFGLLSLANFA